MPGFHTLGSCFMMAGEIMDERLFREKVYANPDVTDPELLAVARENPALQAILDDALSLHSMIGDCLAGPAVPGSLLQRLQSIPDQDSPGRPANDGFFPYYALAACLVMAVGISLATNLRPQPSAADMEFGQLMLSHLYIETSQMGAIAGGVTTAAISQPSTNLVMANADSTLQDSSALQLHPILFAEPCPIQPNSFDSAHLMMRGSKGAINIIVTNSSPVETEFGIADERFQGVVIPSSQGNIVVIGEKDENLGEFKGIFTASVDWQI